MTLESNRTLGGVGALLMLISPLSGFVAGAFGSIIGLIGLILVLIAMKGFADHYNAGGIFNNTLYGVILSIIGAVVFGAAIIVGAADFLSALNLDFTTLSTDPSALSAIDFQELIKFDIIMDFLVIILAALVILFIFVVIAAIFYRKSLSSLAEKTGVGLFGTAGLVLLIGAVLSIVVVGFLLIWVAILLLTIAFFQIKPKAAQPSSTMS